MPPQTAATRPRQTAGARRDALVAAAVKHFAHTGLHGTAVSAITDEVGITQPYAFSLFGTKKGLFLAALEHGFDHLEATFRAAAAVAPEGERMAAMGDAYSALISGDRDWLLLQQQGYAACGDDEVRAVVRRRYAQLYTLVRELSGADPPALTRFFAAGMLMNVAAAMDLPELVEDEGWLSACDPEAGAGPPGA